MSQIASHLLSYNYSMERKEHHKELKASSNEDESPEQAVAGDESSGTSAASAGRYYECIFCRRGFSTAQALGGHMNIHRRERPRIRPAAGQPARREEGYHPYLRETWHPPTSAAENYFVYFPGSSSSMESESPRGRPGAEKETKEEDMEIDDLDLELRLGHGGGNKRP